MQNSEVGVVGCLAALVLTPVTIALEGVTGYYLWNWFVAEHFGVPPLTILTSIGIALLVSFWTHKLSSADCAQDKIDKEEMGHGVFVGRALGTSIGMALWCLGFGWVIHALM